jgi:hypothetical protein
MVETLDALSDRTNIAVAVKHDERVVLFEDSRAIVSHG